MPPKFVSPIRRNLIPLCILLVSLLITLASWRFAAYQEQAEMQQSFILTTQAYRQLLERHMDAYIHFLDGLSGLFAVSDSVSNKQFADYIAQAKITADNPGTNRIAYLPRVPADQKQLHEAQMHAAGFTEYRIRADQQQTEYYPYDYLYPMDANVRQKLLGLDPHLQPERNAAMQQARDADEVISTDKLSELVMPSTDSSYIFYEPIYRADAPLLTVAQRRQALKGYVFAAFRADQLIKHTVGSHLNDIVSVRFYDGNIANRHLLYESDGSNGCAQCITHTETFRAAGKTWTLEFHARVAFGKAYQEPAPLFVLLSGMIASLLLTGIALQRNQKRLLQQAQYEQNQKFRSLFDQNADAIYSLDLSGHFTEANAATTTLLGVPTAELIGKSYTSFIAPDYLADSKKRFMQITIGVATYGELAFINSANKRVSVSATGCPIIRDGKIIGIFCIAKDITTRKAAEDQNRQMRQFLDAIIENIPTGLFVKEAKTLRCIAWNRAHEELTGIPREEALGKTAYDFFEKQEADGYTASDRESLARNEPIDLDEVSLQTRHHGIRLLRTRKVPFWMGDTQYLLCTTDDITERRRAEDALKQVHAELEERVKQRTRALVHEIEARKKSERALLESEEKYRSIFEQAPVGIAHIGPDGKWSKVNQKFCEIVGYPEDELVNRTYIEITHPDDMAQSLDQVKRVIEDNTVSIAYEKRYIRKDGEYVWVNVTRSAVRSQTGDTLYYLSIIENINQRKQAEAALRELTIHLQAIREDERARIAREIHDELGGVLAAVKFDLSFPVRQKDLDQSGIAKRNQETIKLVDNAIVALRRIMADLRPSILDDLGLWAGLEWLATDFEARTGIQTAYRLRGEELDIEPNRATALFRMAQESLTNVAKHAQATEVGISATTTDSDIIIRIHDNGRGIRKDEKSKAKSFGLLGMQERAQAFGGTVKINGRAGEGTTVSIKFPISDK